MCSCKENHWCRDWRETEGGRFPISEHAPGCEEYKIERYVRLFDGDGHSFIDTVENQRVFLSTPECGEWKQEDIYLTPDQCEKMQEYRGL